MKNVEIIVERQFERYVAYPVGFKGAVVGEGDTYEEAVADVKSAINLILRLLVLLMKKLLKQFLRTVQYEISTRRSKTKSN